MKAIAKTLLIYSLLLAACLHTGWQAWATGPATGLSAPEGFQVTLFADDDLAHDIFSLTTNAHGQVVVSGPGYVRILLDQDGDGQADAFRTFADSPTTGAQGLYFDGNDLLCTGDGGLLRFRDQDDDGCADGPPTRLLSLKTGGEHFAHAVERGPDGWWYVLLGNLAGIDRQNVTRSSSPVQHPSAGVLMRIAPDFTTSEVVADGFRNPYDFAFHANGDAFTFDSDGERDISLPWYRPTRVFQVMPGTHAGWVTSSWKQPDYYPDMPATTTSCGRGSPTGVVAYRHHQFPEQYQNALFILDWTFGRVFTVKLTPQGACMTGSVEPFLRATGQFGFAPTDAAVTPVGDLMISVGGRGTRGGVYRVRYVGADLATSPPEIATTKERLTECLSAPQPLASWSRARWTPIAHSLGKSLLIAAATDTSRPVPQRIRAIEIVTELYQKLDAASFVALTNDRSALIRARTAWALGRQQWNGKELEIIQHLLGDDDPQVVRCALNAVLRNASNPDIGILLPHLVQQLDAADLYVWQAAWKVVARLDVQQQLQLAQHIPQASLRVQVAYVMAVTDRRSTCNPPAFDLAWDAFLHATDPQLKRYAIRAAQKALGDMRGRDDLPAVYDGYSNQASQAVPVDIDVASLCGAFPSGDRKLDLELARLIAMLAPDSPVLAQRMGDMLSNRSHPVDDAHYLIALSRLPVRFSPQLRERVATALVSLETKLLNLDLQQDRNWDLRIAEAYQQLTRNDPLLAHDVVSHPQFGLAGHVLFARNASPELQAAAADRIARNLQQDSEISWTNDTVFLLGRSPRPEHRELVRQQFDDFALRGAVILALAEHPVEMDRDKFLVGLQSSDLTVMQASVKALEGLPASQEASELFMLLQVLRRLGADRQERSLRDRVVRLMQRNSDQRFGYQFGLRTNAPQTQAIAGWTKYLKQSFPHEAEQRLKSSENQLTQLLSRLASVDWSGGQPQRGETLFQQQACFSCHNARTAVGPDLSGIGTRFSRNDLFTAIVYPSQNVSPRYNTTLIETASGKILSGLVIYESVDGLTLLDSTNQTIRVESEEIDTRYELSSSLMPAGLLDNLRPQDLADLYAYLKGL